MTLLICRTCPRYHPATGSFAHTLRDTLDTNGVDYRTVLCVGGCNHPGNIVFDAAGKTRVRLSHLTSEHSDAIIAAAEAYRHSATGAPDHWYLPAALEGYISALTPKHGRRQS